MENFDESGNLVESKEQSPTGIENETDEDTINVKIVEYCKEDFAEMAKQISSGEKIINVSATCSVMMVFIRTLPDIIEQMNSIINKDNFITFSDVRTFILM